MDGKKRITDAQRVHVGPVYRDDNGNMCIDVFGPTDFNDIISKYIEIGKNRIDAAVLDGLAPELARFGWVKPKRCAECCNCRDYREDGVTWCAKFRHKVKPSDYCAWPDDTGVK